MEEEKHEEFIFDPKSMNWVPMTMEVKNLQKGLVENN